MKPRVSVVGYLSLDHIEGAPPEPGGAALYAALGAQAAGARVSLVAQVGQDFPAWVPRRLKQLGIDTQELRPAPYPSRRTRLSESQGVRSSPHFQDPAWWQATRQLAPPLPRPTAVAYLYSPMPLDLLTRQLRHGPRHAWRLADTSEAYLHTMDQIMALSALSVFAPSLAETRRLRPHTPDGLAARRLARTIPYVVQKCGPQGLRWIGPHSVRQGSRATQVVDPTGAGDAACGALLAGIARGLPPQRLLHLASGIAARAVAHWGARGLGLEPLPCT